MSNGFSLPAQTLGNKKYAYGAYIEMAFHNFYITLEYIYKTVLGEELDDATVMRYCNENRRRVNQRNLEDFAYWIRWEAAFHYLKNSLPEEKIKARELFGKHFPFLVPIIDSDIKYRAKRQNRRVKDREVTITIEDSVPENYYDYIYKVLRGLSVVMRELRNEYSHYFLIPSPEQIGCFTQNEHHIIRELKNVYDSSKCIVKKRFFPNSDTGMECSDRLLKVSDYEHLNRRGEPKTKWVEIEDFPYKIDVSDLDDPRKTHFSVFGIFMFISLFLEKKYIHLFEDQIKIIAPQDRKVIEEIVACYRLRLPSRKLDIRKSSNALGLDMINEMRRCPKELYDLLHGDDQSKFRISSKKQEDGENDTVETGGEDNDSYLMLRHSDRFAYFAMRYIDECKLLDTNMDTTPINMRFQVSLGKYYYQFDEKPSLGDESNTYIRALSKELNGFGRIDEIEEEKIKAWGSLIRKQSDAHKNTLDEEPYITDHYASYVINNNRVGIKYIKGDYWLPTLCANETRSEAPDCWLSVLDLPAFIILAELNKSKPASIILNNLLNYRQLFNDICEDKLVPKTDIVSIVEDKYEMPFKSIPQKMQDYLLGKSFDTEGELKKHADNLIEEMIKDNKLRQKKIEKEKKKHVIIDPGELADFIAHDIVRLMPMNSAKISGHYFVKLQSAIATYSASKPNELTDILISTHIIGNVNKSLNHPFLEQVIKACKKNVISFYDEYLDYRLRYLESVKNKDVNEVKELSFVHANATKWEMRNVQFYKAQAKRYLRYKCGDYEFHKSIELPRGLFDAAIREEMAGLGNDELKDAAYATTNKGEYKHNISSLIQLYFRIVKGDDAPEYYSYARNYPLFGTLSRKRPQDAKEYMTCNEIDEWMTGLTQKKNDLVERTTLSEKEETKAIEKGESLDNKLREKKNDLKYKLFAKTQKLLRRYKVQDMLVWLMVQHLLFEDAEDLSASGRMGKLEKFKLCDICKGNVLERRTDFYVSVGTGRDAKVIKQKGMRLKDYAQFYRILSDRRMPTLMQLIEDGEILKDKLEDEFDNYDHVHPDVMKFVFDVEKLCSLIKEEAGDTSNTENFYEALQYVANFEDWQVRKLYKVRNSFSHMIYSSSLEQAASSALPEKAKEIKKEFEKQIEDKLGGRLADLLKDIEKT